MVDIRIGYHRIFTDDIKRFERAVVGRRYHLGGFHTGLIGKFGDIPGLDHALTCLGIDDFLIAAINIRKPAHIASPLDIILTAKGIDTAAFNAQIAAEHGEVGQRFDVIGSGGMLGNSHAIQNACALGFGIKPRRLDQFAGRNAGDLLDAVRGEFFNGFLQRFETFGAVFDELFVMQAFFNDHMHQAVDPGHVGTQILTQPFGGISRHPDTPRIDDDESGAF